MRRLALIGLLLLGACQAQGGAQPREAERGQTFPHPDRPVSRIVGSTFSTEDQRDSINEATTVMALADVRPGMTVADIGAGAGYYTVRLAKRVGASGRVLGEDIDARVVDELGNRIAREQLDNVSIRLGKPDDPRLPAASFDRIFLIHMYHEVAEPYAFLWNLRPALRAGARVIVVDLDRPTDQHGTPPALLACEFAAVGFRQRQIVRKPQVQGYLADFEAVGARPVPAAIKPCRLAEATPSG